MSVHLKLTQRALIDWYPPPDLTKFPRTKVIRPPVEENPYNAWATKATVKGVEGGILAGKTVVLKVRAQLLIRGRERVFTF